MEFLVVQTTQIAVTAEDRKEALQKALNGEGKIAAFTMAANPRPQPKLVQPTQPK